MSIEDVQESPITMAAEEPGDEPLSAIELLRRKREEIKEHRTEFFDIPGYDGLLVVEYQLLDFDRARDIGRRHRKQGDPRRLLNAQIDTLIEACVNFHYRDDEGAIKTLDGDRVVRYDKRLAEIMQIEQAETARQIVLGVFENEIAIIDHHMLLMDWMRTGKREAEEEGEA